MKLYFTLLQTVRYKLLRFNIAVVIFLLYGYSD